MLCKYLVEIQTILEKIHSNVFLQGVETFQCLQENEEEVQNCGVKTVGVRDWWRHDKEVTITIWSDKKV